MSLSVTGYDPDLGGVFTMDEEQWLKLSREKTKNKTKMNILERIMSFVWPTPNVGLNIGLSEDFYRHFQPKIRPWWHRHHTNKSKYRKQI